VTAQTWVDPADPVFAGHYPGHPVFPGVRVVGCVHDAAIADPPAGAGPLALTAVESARFLDPVRPGDTLTVDLRWTPAESGWRCAAEVRTGRGPAATVRLGYR
jgi:3-hydroxyacyl-[acyl-carrier-protein] dehydratase